MKEVVTLIRDEKGAVLLWVLILMLVGGLIIAPLLAFMSTGLKATRAYEDMMLRHYAADSGIESALHQIMWDGPSVELPLEMGDDPCLHNIVLYEETPRPISVDIEIGLERDTLSFIESLYGKDYACAAPHSDWMLVYQSPEPGKYEIKVTYEGRAETKFIDGLGAWLRGSYSYIDGSAIGITDEYPDYIFEPKAHRGGTAFIWEWEPPTRPQFHPGDTKTLIFEFEPVQTPTISFGWTDAGSQNIYISETGGFAVWRITATATDDTEKQTTIVAYATRMQRPPEEEIPYRPFILYWEE